MPNVYAPEQFQLDIPKLFPWLAQEEPGKTYLGPNIDWANVPGNILSLSNLADPSGMATMAPFGFFSSPKGLGFPLGKTIKPIKEVVTEGKKLSPAEIIRNKDIFDVIKSEVQKVIRSGKTGPSRTGGGLIDFLGEERGNWSHKYLDALKGQAKTGEITAYHGTTKELGEKILKEGFEPTKMKPVKLLDLLKSERGSVSPKKLLKPEEKFIMPEFKSSFPAKSIEEILGNDLVAEIAKNGYSPQIRAKILARYGTTPERHELVSQAAPKIEELLRVDPTIAKGRGYVFGSFVSDKPNPSDMDLLLRTVPPSKLGMSLPESREAAFNAESVINEAWKKGLHTKIAHGLGSRVNPETGKRVQSFAMQLRDEMAKRYPGSKLVRLWGGLPVGVGLGDLLTGNEAEAQRVLF